MSVGGLSVDWEMKAFLMVSVYAALKLCGSSSYIPDYLVLSVARGFFLLGHVLLTKVFIDATARIKGNNLNLDQKVKAKAKLQIIFRNVCLRGLIIAVVHGRTKMLPPLIISVFSGFFSLISNREYYHLAYNKAPKLFHVFFGIPSN